MKARHFYLILCVLGIVLPYSQFLPWLLESGLNLSLFFRELFANRISAFFVMDVIVSAIVLIWFIQTEGKRLSMRLLWLPMVGTLIVGVSLGLPLFLFLRQAMLDRKIDCSTNDGQ
jgi:Terpene cyclase DEP1